MSVKITRPVARGILARKRLFQKLDRSLTKPVVWITAPAGYGKTTLVSSYVDARNLPCLWYQVDAGDSDPSTFFHYLCLAGRKAAPRRKRPLPALTPEYDRTEFSRNFFGDLVSGLPSPSLMVLDNVQQVSGRSFFFQAILEGLSRVPDGFCTIMISRTGPPSLFARMRANRTLGMLTGRELRLTFKEFEAIVRSQGFQDEDTEILEQLYSKVDGWVAGLQLILKCAESEGIGPYALGSSTPEVVFDYFAGEVFEKADDATRRCLLRTAFLPKISVHVAQRIAGTEEVATILSFLASDNFFTVERSGPAPEYEPTYEYHPLFRHFLIARVKHTFSGDYERSLKQESANLLADDGQTESSAELFIEIEDWQSLTKLILKTAQAFLHQGRAQTIVQWIQSIPADIVDTSPWLLYWLGVCTLQVSPSTARYFYQKSYYLFKKQEDVPGIYLSWSGVVDTIVYEWGDFKRFDHWITEIQQLQMQYPEIPTGEIEVRVTCSMFMALMYRQPNQPLFSHWEKSVRQIAMEGGNPRLRMEIGNHLLMYYMWWNASRAKVEMLANALRPLSEASGIPPLMRITWQIISSGYHWTRMENTQAIAAALVGLQLAEKTGIRLWDMFLLVQAVIGALSSNDLALAGEYLRKMATLVDPRRHMDSSMYYYQAAWNEYLNNNLEGAHDYIIMGLDHAERSGSPAFCAISRIALARTLFYKGKKNKAGALLQQALAEGERIDSNSVRLLTWFAEAEFALKSGDDDAWRRAMKEYLNYLRLTGVFGQVFTQYSVLTHLLIKALENDMETSFVKRMIRLHNLVPEYPPVHLESWPWPIRVYTLGRFEIVIDGKPLQYSGKAQRKPLEFLKCLVALGGRKVREERLADALWPETDGDRQMISLHTTLHRLRQLLGLKEAIRYQDGYLTLDARYCWVDVWAFERLHGLAEKEWQKPKPDSEKAKALTEKALILYKTGFLPQSPNEPWDGDECADSWSGYLRDRLRSKFLLGVKRLADQLESSQRWQDALVH